MSRWDALKKSAVLASRAKTPADTINFIADADPLTVIELIAENDRLRDESHKNRMNFVDEVERRDQLRAEVEALRKDAERYRWLREQGGDERRSGNPFIAIDHGFGLSQWTYGFADEKVDIAMRKDRSNG